MAQTATSLLPERDQLDEILITKEFNVAEALSSIQFYWNLARHRGEQITVRIEKHQPAPKDMAELYHGYQADM